MPTLHSPLTFRSGCTIQSRAVLAPMTNLQSHEDGSLGDDELRWLRRRARGGFGLVETCAAFVTADGQAWPGQLGVHVDAMEPGLSRLASAVCEGGAAAIAQLFHGGARCPAELVGTPWSACAGEISPGTRAGTEEDIARTIRAFASAAARAQRAGFTGVEVHGAHGYLPCQFLSRVHNTRQDDYGGSYAGRARFLREIVRAVRGVVGEEFCVGVRISLEDFGQAVGMDLDEGLTLACELVTDGAEYIHASLWDAARMSTKRPEFHPIGLLRAVLPSDVPLIVAGKIWSRADADAALDRGADAVAVGRAAIAHPEWPRGAVDPAYAPAEPPFSVEALRAADLSPRFVEYMRRWKGFVA